MPNRFTIGFQLKPMSSLLNLNTPTTTTRRKKVDVQRKTIRRIREIATFVSQLNIIMRDCPDRDEARYLAAATLMDTIHSADHILSVHSFAFPRDLNRLAVRVYCIAEAEDIIPQCTATGIYFR